MGYVRNDAMQLTLQLPEQPDEGEGTSGRQHRPPILSKCQAGLLLSRGPCAFVTPASRQPAPLRTGAGTKVGVGREDQKDTRSMRVPVRRMQRC